MAVRFSRQSAPLSLKSEVGALIRTHREAARLTQADLADRAGRSLELIGKIERGGAAASFDTLEALAKALDVPVSAFFQIGNYEAGGSNPILAKIVNRLAKLDPDDLEWADRLLSVGLSRKIRAAPEV